MAQPDRGSIRGTRNTPGDYPLPPKKANRIVWLEATWRDGLELRLQGTRDATYRLEYSDTISDAPEWHELTPRTLSAESETLRDPAAPAATPRIYRAVYPAGS